jgi:Domain of unknown function (DUF4440)
MRRFFLIFLLFTYSSALHAQDTTAVKEAVDRLEKALVERDSTVVKSLLHNKAQFGHSNGWVQNKDEVIRDMNNGYLRYVIIDRQSVSIKIDGKFAVAKEWMEVTGNKGGTDFKIKLFVLQQWIKTKKGWQLWIRQSAKQT